jgi:hypothetical protein
MRFRFGLLQPLRTKDNASVSQLQKRRFFLKGRQNSPQISQFSLALSSLPGDDEVILPPFTAVVVGGSYYSASYSLGVTYTNVFPALL